MKYTLLIIFIIKSLYSYSQTVDINFIISIDNDINPNINNIKLKVVSKNNDTLVYDLNYVPGKLTINKKFFDDVENLNIKSITFELTYWEIINDYTKYYYYEIDDFNKHWLESYFFVLYIYNTNKKKYKKVFFPLLDKEYTYEYDSPEGSMRRVTKRNRE